MDARRRQTQGGRSAAVHTGPCIDFSPRLEQNLSDLHSVPRSLLAIAFHAIGRHIMQQRSPMLTCRTRANQLRILPQQTLQSAEVAGDDRIRRQFKLRDGGILADELFQLSDKFGPTLESVRTRYHALCVGKAAVGGWRD